MGKGGESEKTAPLSDFAISENGTNKSKISGVSSNYYCAPLLINLFLFKEINTKK